MPLSAIKTFRTSHTFTVPDLVAVASGDTDYIPPFFLSLATGQTVNLVAMRYRVNSGSATIKLQRNAADITGFGTTAAPISVTTTATSTTPTAVTLAADDLLALVVVASTTARNMTVTLYLEHTV